MHISRPLSLASMVVHTPIPKHVVGLLSTFLIFSTSASNEALCNAPPNASAPSLIQVQKIPAPMTVFTVKSSVDHGVARNNRRHHTPAVSALAAEALAARAGRAAPPLVRCELCNSRESGFLHSVVGEDGVLQISLKRKPERAQYSAEKLGEVGIHPTVIPAADSEGTPQDVLNEGCDYGCSASEAAVALSHKRALELAGQRNSEWTAILEDDAIPVLVNGMSPSTWDGELRRIWSQLPGNARIVRLSYCVLHSSDWYVKFNNDFGTEWGPEKMKFTQFAVDNAKAAIWNSVGLCTSAYVVHRDIIPDMLKTFPCNCALDACLGWKFYNAIDQKSGQAYSTYLYNLDLGGSVDLEWREEGMNWYGAMRQAHEALGTSVTERAGR